MLRKMKMEIGMQLLSVKNFCNEVTTYSEDSDFNNDSPIIINGFCASLINFETS